MLPSSRYAFGAHVAEYQRYRPRWPAIFAQRTLAGAALSQNADGSWTGTAGRPAPIVACMGAGTGFDAEAFKAMGCTVILVEPDPALLQAARRTLEPIRRGTAHFRAGTAECSGIDPQRDGRMDLIVAAQSIHAFTDQFAGPGAELRTRRHWSDILVADGGARLAVWSYNPDPREAVTLELDRVLSECSTAYATSATPFIDTADIIRANVEPWIDVGTAQVSRHLEVGGVRLTETDLCGWLASYSFRPRSPQDMSMVCGHLRRRWFDAFAIGGVVTLPYTGTIIQGRLKRA